MTCTYRSGHVSQLRLNPDGTYAGDEDCGPACAVRYLREAGGIAADADRLEQINDFRLYVDGAPDQEGQGGTSLSDVERYMGRFGIPSAWSSRFQDAFASPVAVVLITAPPLLSDGSWPYDESWLGGAEHWILWLQACDGTSNHFNDPLTYFGGERDTHLDLGYLQRIFAGAILLPGQVSVSPPWPQPILPAHITTACALKIRANHTSGALAHLVVGNRCLLYPQRAADGTGTTWARIQWAGRYGWVPEQDIRAA